MKMLGIAALAATVFASSIPEAKADPCDAPGAEAKEFWEQWAKVVKIAGCAVAKAKSDGSFSFPACLEHSDKYNAAIKEMLKSAHQGKDDSSKYGPRHIDFNDSQRGRVKGTDGPVFRTAAPMRTDRLDVTLSPTEGTGKVKVLLCKENQAGKRTKMGSVVLEYGKGKSGDIVSKTFTDVKNHVVRMRVEGDTKDTKGEFTVLFEAREPGAK